MNAEMKIAKVLAGHRYRVSEFDGAICSCGAIVTASVSNTDIKAAWPKHQASVIVAALGIDELGCGCDEADDNLKAAIKRAEDAEAFGAAAVTRAEEAEATVARVREATAIWGDRFRPAVLAALDPKPAFTLPTEAGARFTAQGNDDKPGSRTSFLTLVGGGRVVYMAVDDVRCVYEAAGVMEHYTDHRLA